MTAPHRHPLPPPAFSPPGALHRAAAPQPLLAPRNRSLPRPTPVPYPTPLRAPRTRPTCGLDLSVPELRRKEVVYLGSRGVGDAGAAAVGEALRGASRIRSVNLDSCGITCAGAAALAGGLAGNTTLEELVLYDNAVGDDGAAALADALGRPGSALRCLSLPRNRVGPAGGAALGCMIGQNVALQTVYLMGQARKGGGMGDEGAVEWARGIRENVGDFWFVNLDGNGIGELGLQALREARVVGKHTVFPVDPYPR